MSNPRAGAHRAPPKIPRGDPAPIAQGPTVSALLARLWDAPEGERDGIVESFWAGPAAVTPLVEAVDDASGERIVTFLWRDARAERVLLFVNRITDERTLDDSLMRRVPGTDLWHLGYRMRSDWRASYAMLRHEPGQAIPWESDGGQPALRGALDRGLPDPRNPLPYRNRIGTPMSVVQLPDAPPQRWWARRDGGMPRGTLFEAQAPRSRRVWIYRPAAPTPPGPLPGIVVLDGDAWTGTQNLVPTLDNLIADGEIPPSYAVFLDSIDRQRRWDDHDPGSGIDRYLVDELLPWAREHWPITSDPAGLAVAGQSLGGLTALRTVLRHPERIGNALVQSASLWQRDPGEEVAEANGAGRFYLEVGQQEWVLHPLNRVLAGALAEAGIDVVYREYNGGHDYACWRGGLADGLRELLGGGDPRSTTGGP